MASKLEFVEYVCAQIAGAGEVQHKRMFGEYGIHLNGKYIAAVCDNQLFMKPTPKGRELLITPDEQPPYEGASVNYFLLEDLEDTEFLTKLFQAAWEDLPFPKPKKPKNPKAKKG